MATEAQRVQIFDYLVAQNMVTPRCQNRYILQHLTWSTRLINAHSLCSILCILDFRRIPTVQRPLSIQDSPNSRSKRPHDDDTHPAPKRRRNLASEAISNGQVQPTISTTTAAQPVDAPDVTFEESLLLEKETGAKDVGDSNNDVDDEQTAAEMQMLYDEYHPTSEDIRLEYEEALAKDCDTVFEVMDQLKSELILELGFDPSDSDSMLWDDYCDLINMSKLQESPVESTPSPKIHLHPSNIKTTPVFSRPDDSPPSSAPTPPSSVERDVTPSNDSIETPSQLTMILQGPQPRSADTFQVPEHVLIDHSDNALDSEYIILITSILFDLLQSRTYIYFRYHFPKTKRS